MLDLGTMQYAARCSKRDEIVEAVAAVALNGYDNVNIDVPSWFDKTDWDYIAINLQNLYGIDLTDVGLVD